MFHLAGHQKTQTLKSQRDLTLQFIVRLLSKIWKTTSAGCRQKRTPAYCPWEHKLRKPAMKTVWWFLKKLKTDWLYDLATPHLHTSQKAVKVCSPTCPAINAVHNMISISTCLNGWFDEENTASIQNETLSSFRNREILNVQQHAKGNTVQWNK